MCERKKYPEKRGKTMGQILERMQKLLLKGSNIETKIQCSWPIHETDIYKTYFDLVGLGLSLETIEDKERTEKRLTKTAKQKIDWMWEDNHEHYLDYGSGKSDDGMTEEVFSKEESYYHKPVKYVLCKNIKLKLKSYLGLYFDPLCVLLILSF